MTTPRQIRRAAGIVLASFAAMGAAGCSSSAVDSGGTTGSVPQIEQRGAYAQSDQQRHEIAGLRTEIASLREEVDRLRRSGDTRSGDSTASSERLNRLEAQVQDLSRKIPARGICERDQLGQKVLKVCDGTRPGV